MLCDFRTGKPVAMPQKARRDLDDIEQRMEPEQWVAMHERIKRWAAETGPERTDFFASSWKASYDWEQVEDGIFQPLYLACSENFDRAGHMFGWLVRLVMIEVAENEPWVMYKNPEAGTPECPREFWGTFYWRGDRAYT